MYILDTNICIYIIRQRPMAVLEKFEEIPADELAISVVTYAELQYGVDKSSSKQFNQNILDQFVNRLNILSWDRPAAREYGLIRSSLEAQGTPIGPLDLLIAAHAISQVATLVTNNLREFERVSDLKLENWA
ncbi:MAG: type II toxin-antitoxin system VapC family toxin [Chloroflexota bacterium]